MSVVAAVAAVAAAAAESALIKLAIRLSLSWGWVGVFNGSGLHAAGVVSDRIQVGHIGLGGAESQLA